MIGVTGRVRRVFGCTDRQSGHSTNMGAPEGGGECGIAHIGGAKTIRPVDFTAALGGPSVLEQASGGGACGAGMHHDRLG